MPYVGKKPADIIATAVDTTTGTFSGEIDAASLDISGDIDVDGTTNLDAVDIDGAVDMASTLTVTGVAILNGGIDIAGDFTLDVGGGDISIKDDGTTMMNIGIENSDVIFNAQVSDKDIIFKGNDGGSSITALTLDMSAGGNATFNGSIFSGGNVVVPNGNGIDFSAAGNVSGMTSELLNDYEEGTFTATLFGTSSGSGTNVTTTGSYIKVGKHVTIGAYFQNVNLSSMSGSMNIIGLPFTTNGEASSINTGSVALYGFSFTGFVTPYIGNNSTTIDMLDSRTGAAWAGLAVPQAAGKYMIISLTYKSS